VTNAAGHPKQNRWTALALLTVALLLAFAGQYVLSYRRAVRAGLLLYATAAGELALLAGWRAFLSERTPRWMRPLALVASVALVGWATYLAHWRGSLYSLLPWLAGVTLAAATLWRPLRLRLAWREVAGVALLFAVALVLRLVRLADFPWPMSGDEGSMAMEARRVLSGQWLNPFGTGWFSHPSLYFYLLAGSLRLFGWNLFALRLPAALLGALGVPAVYLLARGLLGRPTAWVAALFLTGWSLPLHISRLALNNSADPLFAALTVGLLHRGLVQGHRGYFVAAGLSLGLSLYFYFGTRLLVVLVVLIALLGGGWRMRRCWRGLASMALVAFLVVAPLGVHFLRHPAEFASRVAVDGLFQSGELQMEQAATGASIPALLLRHLAQASLAFIYTTDRGYFYTAPTPMLHALAGALFMLGLLWALFHLRQRRFVALLLWLALVVLTAGWMVRTPPGYHRYLIAAPAVCLLVGWGLVATLRRISQALRLRPKVWRAAALLVGVFLAVGDVGYYFGVYAPSGAFADPHTEIADRAARLMVGWGPEYHTYFLGTPMMPLGGFNSVRFLAPDAVWEDVFGELPAGWEQAPADEGRAFIVLPERLQVLDDVQHQCPNGEETVVIGRHGEVLFHTYRLPPGATCLMEEGGTE